MSSQDRHMGGMISILGVCVCVCVCVLSCLVRVQLFAAPWTIAHQAPLSMRFSRQEYGSGLPFPSPGDLPDPGMETVSLAAPALAGELFTTKPPRKFLMYPKGYSLYWEMLMKQKWISLSLSWVALAQPIFTQCFSVPIFKVKPVVVSACEAVVRLVWPWASYPHISGTHQREIIEKKNVSLVIINPVKDSTWW